MVMSETALQPPWSARSIPYRTMCLAPEPAFSYREKNVPAGTLALVRSPLALHDRRASLASGLRTKESATSAAELTTR